MFMTMAGTMKLAWPDSYGRTQMKGHRATWEAELPMSSLLRVLTHVRSQRWQVPAPYNHTKYTLQKDIGAAIDTSNYIKVSTLTGVSEGAPYTIISPALAAAANAYDAKADPSYFPEEILRKNTYLNTYSRSSVSGA